MFSRVKTWQMNVIVFMIVSGAILIGLSFSQMNGAASIFYPAAGFASGFYYLYKKRIIIGLFSAVFITNFFYRLFVVEESIWISLGLCLFYLIVTVIEVHIFIIVMGKLKYKVEKAFSLVESGKFMLAVIAASLCGSFFGILSLYVFLNDVADIVQLFGFWFIGDAMGIIVFASLMLNHFYHDSPIFEQKNQAIKGMVLLAIYGMFLFFIFGQFGNDFLSFGTFQVFIVLMYIVSAFIFSFRMITIMNILFLMALSFFHFPSITEDVFMYQAIELSLFLIIISSVASVIRMVILTQTESIEQMRIARESLEKIIISTNNLVNVDSTITEEEQRFGREYLRNMFEIACELYPNFDRASCNMANGKTVEFIAVKGYDRAHLNSMEFLSNEFNYELNAPEIVSETDYDKVFDVQDKAIEFVDHYGNLVKSIRFTVIIGENKFAGMSFDLFEGSPFDFTQKDLHSFKSFQDLMNSYYRIGVLNSERDILKDDIVLSLVRTLELYDLYTSGHSEQVARLCYEFGKDEKLSNDELRDLYWSGIVHDIGKIGMPTDVLNLSRRLTSEEYALVKEHPQNGYNILSRSKSLENIAEVVLHHHEWYNGKGYPYGIKGKEIPYHARILHVCDAVDSMAKDRVYRKALTEDQIIQELQTGKGKQFDPDITDKMIRLIRSGRLYEII